MATLDNLREFGNPANPKSLSLATWRDRYASVNQWVWDDGLLKDHVTGEKVRFDGEPPWDFVVFLPGDARSMLKRIEELTSAYDELYEFCSTVIAENE